MANKEYGSVHALGRRSGQVFKPQGSLVLGTHKCFHSIVGAEFSKADKSKPIGPTS